MKKKIRNFVLPILWQTLYRKNLRKNESWLQMKNMKNFFF